MIRRVGWALIGAALLVFAFLGYQLFVTDLLNERVQAEAQEELEDDLTQRRSELPEPEVVSVELPEEEPESPSTTTTSSTVATRQAELYEEEAGEEGSPLGRMVIPALDVDEVMFEGVGREALKKGPGHMPWTPVPGQPGNSVVSGHRTTYGRPFYDLDKLEEGDRIEVETAVGSHVFEVRRILVVEPTDVWVTEHERGAWLTLTTCHPRFSAAERLVVQAELVEGPNYAYASLLTQTEDGGEEPT